MRVSIIIPTLNEAGTIERTLSWVRQVSACEIIVVDGGSEDGTVECARPYVDRLVTAPRGRARQMNVGARAASGEALLFLHADTIPPEQFPELIANALADPEVVGGRFDVHVDAPGWPFRAIGTLMNIRSRLTGIATGDQGIFVRRAVFETIGGYPEWDIMEDLEFSRQLKRSGKIACLRARVKTSARRWQQHGVTKTIMLMWGLRLCHFFGVSPASLKTFYADTR